MAGEIRVYHGGDNSDGSTWAKAYTSIENAAVLGSAAGSVIWVASDHTEQKNGSSFNIAFTNGSYASPTKIVSVKRADDSYESMATGGGIIETQGSADDILINGYAICVGLKLVAKDLLYWSVNSKGVTYIDCYLDATDNVQGGIASVGQFIGCTIHPRDGFYATGSSNMVFRGCTFANVYVSGHIVMSSGPNVILIEDCDLSSEPDLVDNINLAPGCQVTFRRCTFATSFVVADAEMSRPDSWVLVESCISGTSTDAILGMQRLMTYYGDAYAETTIYRSGGASDGTTPYSWKMTSNANAAEYLTPLRSPPITRWLSAGSQTLTLNINHEAVGGGESGDLQNDEFWIEVHSGNESTPASSLGRMQTTLPATILTTPSDLTNNSETWESAKSVKQHVSVTVDPEEAGPVTIYACLGKPSVTVYVDPKIEVS